MSVRAADVRKQLQNILQSPIFVSSPRLSRLLRFAVDQTLSGREERLKEYVIGIEVFERPATFNPRTDSIVRVEAKRLRSKLAEYYETTGKDDSILLVFPPREYIPQFVNRSKRHHQTQPPPAGLAGMKPPSVQILIIEADPAAARLMKDLLMRVGYPPPLVASSAQKALDMVVQGHIRLVLVGTQPDGDIRLSTLRDVVQTVCGIVVLQVSGGDDQRKGEGPPQVLHQQSGAGHQLLNEMRCVLEVLQRRAADEKSSVSTAPTLPLQIQSGDFERNDAAAECGIWQWDLEDDKLFLSRAALAMHSLAVGQRIVTKKEFLHCILPDDAPSVVIALQNAALQPRNIEVIYRVATANGRARKVIMRGAVATDSFGNVVSLFGVCVEANQQPRQTLQAFIDEGPRPERHFAMSVSQALPPAVHTAYAARLSPTPALLCTENRGDTEVQALTTTLLKRTAQSHSPHNHSVSHQQTDAAAVLKAVLAKLAPCIRESGAEITCESLPVVNIPSAELSLVMQNLISSAVTSCSEPRPRIHVSAQQTGCEWVFSVRRNGIGAAAQHHANIVGRDCGFYNRDLASEDILLAICKEVIECIGGKTGVITQEGAGSVYYFTIPA